MENQLKAYDKYILYVFIAQTIVSFSGLWVESAASLTWLAYAFYVYAVFKDTDQIAKAGKVPPSKWWVLILPVYLWKRANVLSSSKQAFWGVIATMCIAFILSCVLITAGIAHIMDTLEEAPAAQKSTVE